MKHFFYTVLLLGSAGTIAYVINPPLVQQLAQQAASIAGLTFESADMESSPAESGDDHLSKFLAQYPFANKENTPPDPISYGTVFPTSQEPALPPPISQTPFAPPMPPIISPPLEVAAPVPPLAPPIPAAAPPVSEPPSFSSTASTQIPAIQPALVDNWSDTPAVPFTAEPITAAVPPQQPFVPLVPIAEPVYAQHDPFSTPLAPLVPPQQSIYAVQTPPSPPGRAVTYQQQQQQQQQQQPPPPQQQLAPLQPLESLPEQKVATQFQINPSVMVEEIPCYGAEIVARVGTQVILMCDLLPKLRRAALRVVAENLKRLSDEERAKVPNEEKEKFIASFIESQYPQFLQEQLLVALVFNDFCLSKSKQERDFIDKRLGDDFDRDEVPEMIKEFGVKDQIALKQYLKENLGSSLERERMLWIREKISQQWNMASMQQATGECTHDEMLDFYESNKAMFTTEAKARWQEMIVLFSKYKSEQEALDKIRWMGNQVLLNNAPFEEIVKANSDGFTASEGGVWEWTTKGSLSSAELEQAIFTQQVGQLSTSIIKGDKGFHIIRVLERQDQKVTPFIDAQVTIREKIKNQRRQKHQEEYFANLQRRFPSIVIKDKIDFNVNPRTAGLR
ncbi:hypothetical protein FACS1894189_6330 [Planctomycetales bacterium]|nr:hypothetical protein FACS1894189_6330 [Planctomycetales bacterium]